MKPQAAITLSAAFSGVFVLLLLGTITGCKKSTLITSATSDSDRTETSSSRNQQVSRLRIAGTETRITTESYDQTNPVIFGDFIVWNSWNSPGGIDYWDVITQTKDRINNRPQPFSHDISGDHIVWSEYVDGVNIFLYDASTQSTTRLTRGLVTSQPAISGNYIVWVENQQLLLYNLNNNRVIPITKQGAPSNPDIAGTYIVWQDHRSGNWDIYLFDLSTKSETQITSDPGEQISPVVSGQHIVWEDRRNGSAKPDLYLYNLSTQTESQITSDRAGQFSPAISGNYVVWEDDRNDNLDIYLYDLATNIEYQITNNPADQLRPAISGNRIVWEDHQNGSADVYLYELAAGRRSISVARGNGVINSPADAYAADGFLCGKARFSLQAKSANHNIKGKATFAFQAANLKFKSKSIDRFFISGSSAQIKGSGTVNNRGWYSFLLKIADGNLPEDSDKYRIKIWNPRTSRVMYDTEPGSDDHKPVSTPILEGKIVIR